MLNLINAEFYKLRKSKSFFVCCITIILFVLFIYGCFILAEKSLKGEIQTEAIQVEWDGQSMQEEQSVLESISIMDVEKEIIISLFGMVVVIFVSLFVIADYGNGAIKNIVGKGFTRRQIISAKYIVTSIAVIGMIVITTITILLMGVIFLRADTLNEEFFRNLFSYVGIEILLYMAFTGIAVLVSEITRNIGLSIAINMGIFMLSGIITAGIDLLLNKYNVLVSDYWITDIITNCPTTAFESEFVSRAVVVAIVWAVLAFLAGNLHFKKADIK